MKKVFSWLILAFISLTPIALYSQKKNIDSTVFNTWPSLQLPLLSPNGNYLMYCVENYPLGFNTIVIKSLGNNWTKKIITKGVLPYDAKINDSILVFLKGDDSLCIVELGKDVNYIKGYTSFKISESLGSNTILAYNGNDLTIIKNSSKSAFANVLNYEFIENEEKLLIQMRNESGADTINTIKIIDLKKMATTDVWSGYGILSTILNEKKNKLCLYNQGKFQSADYIVIIDLLSMKKNKITIRNFNDLEFTRMLSFSKDEKNVLATFKKKQSPVDKNNILKLRIWNYKDAKISEREENTSNVNEYLASISIDSFTIKRLQWDNDNCDYSTSQQDWGKIILMSSTEGDCDYRERVWNKACKRNWYLVNISTGKRDSLTALNGRSHRNVYELTPDGNFILFFDHTSEAYYSLNTTTHVLHNLTSKFPDIFSSPELAKKGYILPGQRGLAGWGMDGHTALIYDENDIWLINPSDTNSIINLTNGYGKKNNITFSFLKEKKHVKYSQDNAFILTSFNISTKSNGFYKLSKEYTNPELLSEGDFIYYIPFGQVFRSGGMPPIKAANANIYLCQRESVNELPNFFLTSDFRTFDRVSNFRPEKDFNWIESQLCSWNLPDGLKVQGILYRPKNLDTSKKYPVIIQVYEQFSNSLNAYFKPEPLCNGCTANPPYISNNGYLLFRPDIYYKSDSAGECALRVVETAVKELARYNWVDTSRMAIHGCSFGGFETNYIVSHTNLFKAACSASSSSDLFSFSSRLMFDTYTAFNWGQFRINRMIWEDPSSLIRYSTIFNVQNINTPLLLFHTTDDNTFYFEQAAQLFLLCRRLNKPCWLLQYGGANHGIYNFNQSKDFSIRMIQFFDTYLKGKNAPSWMNNSEL